MHNNEPKAIGYIFKNDFSHQSMAKNVNPVDDLRLNNFDLYS